MTGLTGKSETRNNPGNKSEPALAAGGRRSRVTACGARWPASQAFINGLSGSCQMYSNQWEQVRTCARCPRTKNNAAPVPLRSLFW